MSDAPRFTASVSRPLISFTTGASSARRSEEHTSELQSRLHLVCRLLLEKKKNKKQHSPPLTTTQSLLQHSTTPTNPQIRTSIFSQPRYQSAPPATQHQSLAVIYPYHNPQ